MNACKATEAGLLARWGATEAEDGEPVEVAEAPGGEAEAGDAEEGVEDLRVDFHPDAAGGLDVVAGRRAHCGGGVAEEEEEHAAPGDDVEAVEGDEEAREREEPRPEGFEADDGGGRPGEFGRGDVSVGVLEGVSLRGLLAEGERTWCGSSFACASFE